MESVEILKYEIMLSANRNNLTSSFLVSIPFISFSYIIGLFKTLNTILNVEGMENLVLSHCLGKLLFGFSLFSIMLAKGW